MTTQPRIVLPRIAAARRQKGAALVVGLMLLMVLTLFAISGMNTATMELQMAGNAQYSENAFQAAETGIDRRSRREGQRREHRERRPGKNRGRRGHDRSVQDPDASHPENGVTKVPTGGFSMGVGKGFAPIYFDVTSTGTSSRSAVETHVQSFYVVAQAAK